MEQGSFSIDDTGTQNYADYEEEEIMDLHKACRLGDIAAIKQAFRAQPDKLNEKDVSLGWAPLYRTVICGHVQAVEFLLKQGADPNVINNLGETPLHAAADNAQIVLAEVLLQYRANPNLQQNDGDTPLHHASFRGDLQMVELLLRFKANPNIPNFLLARTPFHTAVSAGHLDCIECLFLSGGDMTLTDKQRKTVFEMAGTSAVQELLIRMYKEQTRIPDFDEEFSHEVGRIQNHMLSPISEVISFNQSDMEESQDMELNVNLKISPPRTERGDTLATTPQKKQTDAEKSSKKKLAPVLKPLYEWLEKDNLQDLYEVLVEAGYDDVEEMVEQMRSPLPITEESLRKIGVSKPGHCVRLLMRLEEECGLKQKFTRRKSPGPRQKNFLQCCAAPNNTTFGLVNAPSLREWLRELKLDHLYENFRDSGYDDYEALVDQMSWRIPITELILEKDIKVMKPGHRGRILSKLKEDSLNRDRGETEGLVVETSSKTVACETCSMM